MARQIGRGMGTVSYPSRCSTVIEKGITFLLIFNPLAFGTVHDWSIAIMEAAAFVILGAWLLKMAFTGKFEVVRTPLLGLTATLLVLVLFQLVPLPPTILKILSPSTALIYDRIFGMGEWEWRTLSVNPGATLEGLYELLAYSAVFFVTINFFKTKSQVKGVLKTIVYTACFLVLFALVQKATWNGKLFWFYEIDSALQSHDSLIWGPYINRNHFAGFVEMVMPLTAGMLLYRSSSIVRTNQRQLHRKISSFIGSSHFPQVAAWSLAVLALAATVFMTLSRGGIMAMSISMFLLIALIRTRRSLRRKSIILVMVGFVIFFLVVMASWDRIANRFEAVAETNKVQRFDVWSDALNIMRTFPSVGTGLGTFKTIYPGYQTKYPHLQFEHTENDYIELMTDLGLAGVIVIGCLVAVYTVTVVKAWQKRHDLFVTCIVAGGIASCAAMAVHSFTDFNTRIQANAMLFTIILAITYTTALNVNKSSISSDRIDKNKVQRKQVSLSVSEIHHA